MYTYYVVIFMNRFFRENPRYYIISSKMEKIDQYIKPYVCTMYIIYNL